MLRAVRVGVAVGSLVVAAVGCGGDSDATPDATVEFPPPLPPLPPPGNVDTDRFADSVKCAQCHLSGTSPGPALRDSADRDVSPVKLWRTSMMGMAARDPFYLAAFSEELRENPGATQMIETVCTRCHAPGASEETADQGGHVRLTDLTTNTEELGHLARDGVTCSLCHQIRSTNLRDEASFTGGYSTDFSREIYGPHIDPETGPMMMFVRFTPTQSDHIIESAVCGTCHTVIVRKLDEGGQPYGPEVVEQATYLEWRNSEYSTEGGGTNPQRCIACHLPVDDEDGNPIIAPIAKLPNNLGAREPFGRHMFVGGGAYMQRLFAANTDWVNVGISAAEFEEAAARSEEHLRSAAVVMVTSASRDGADAVFDVQITNQAGHKLPTGYPSRRLWLHVTVTADGQTVFESGAPDADGRLAGVDGEGDPVPPHYDEIDSDDKIAIYQLVFNDEDSVPTHRALGADSVSKDNRILPRGYRDTHSDAPRTAPVGTDGDTDFVGGSDTVTYRICDVPAGVVSIQVRLMYQTLSPRLVDELATVPTAEAVRFSNMARALAPTPIELESVTAALP